VPERLDLPRAALLVALVRGASYYNPRRHPQRVRKRLQSTKVGDPLDGAEEPRVSAPATPGRSKKKRSTRHPAKDDSQDLFSLIPDQRQTLAG